MRRSGRSGSAAGGGKTSLLRLFTPSVLHNLHSRRSEEPLKELYRKLCGLGALVEDGPCLLGVMLMCGRNYAILQELDIDPARRQRLFFGLLNVRIILATLRSGDGHASALLSRGRGPALREFDRRRPAASRGLSFPCSGRELFDWSSELEARICEMLDSFGPLRVDSLPGNDDLFSLSLMRPDALSVDGRPVASRSLLMMDDIHKLTGSQRENLFQEVIEAEEFRRGLDRRAFRGPDHQ